MVRCTFSNIVVVVLNLRHIQGIITKSASFSKANVSCFDDLMQSDKPNSLIQCCGYCLNTPTCEAVEFENEICHLFSNLLCCNIIEMEKEVFVDDTIMDKSKERTNSPCKFNSLRSSTRALLGYFCECHRHTLGQKLSICSFSLTT